MTNPEISICIATFQRPDGLERLFQSLKSLQGVENVSFEMIVVDNDAQKSAMRIVDNWKKRLPEVRYFIEPRQNIAHARNRAIVEARGDWVVFIDDDEIASPQWLAAYLSAIKKHAAEGYFGPVLAQFEESVETWLDQNAFFDRARFETGKKLSFEQTRTGNAFIKRSALKSFQFNPEYGLTGGSDVELFSRMLDAGHRFVWVDEAEVTEFVPVKRVRFSWLMQRAFRGGLVWSKLERQRRPGVKNRLARVCKALGGYVLFSLLVPFELLRGRTLAAKRVLRICTQAGHLWSALNLTYEEYRKSA